MSEQVVLVTGALAGIGRATATAFARDGASVVVSGRRDAEGETLAAELREPGGKAEYIRADVSIEDDVRSLVEGTVKTFGRLDAAVNNAGYTGGTDPLTTQTAPARSSPSTAARRPAEYATGEPEPWTLNRRSPLP
jgi:NAD(P)-dependent dehydrogenase (short-subunit alcohol dehydrogenase family)